DESLRAAVTLQSPVALFPETDPSSRSFLRLAETLQRVLENETPRGGFASFWLRQFRERRQLSVAGRARPAGNPVAVPATPPSDSAYLPELRSRLQLLMEREGGQQHLSQLLSD